MNYDDQIYGCAYECPWQKRNQKCPFNEIEHLSFKEKIVWMKGISNEEKETIIIYHLYCTKNRD